MRLFAAANTDGPMFSKLKVVLLLTPRFSHFWSLQMTLLENRKINMGIIFCLIEQQLGTTFDANFGDCIHFIIITIEIVYYTLFTILSLALLLVQTIFLIGLVVRKCYLLPFTHGLLSGRICLQYTMFALLLICNCCRFFYSLSLLQNDL